MTEFRLIDLHNTDTEYIRQAAQILPLAFAEMAPDAWPTLEDGLEELDDILSEEKNTVRAAINPAGEVVGWVGSIEEYDGHTWELHPLAVHPDWQGKGIGRALVDDFMRRAKAAGVTTVMLGTDDQTNMTSLSQVQNLYENTWEHIRNIRNLKGHPYEFYQKCGFHIVGVLPDANGPQKPDIFMARRVE